VKNKRIIFEITHPKHFHQFKNLVKALEEDNEILIVARNKDVVLSLLKDINTECFVYNDYGKNIFAKILFPHKAVIPQRRNAK